MIGGREIALSDVTFTAGAETPFAVVVLSSLTEEPISKSKHLLLTSVARVKNSEFGMKEEDGKWYVGNTGKTPIVAERVLGEMTLLNKDRRFMAYSLSFSGQRSDTGISLNEHNGVTLPFGKADTFFHEIVAEE